MIGQPSILQAVLRAGRQMFTRPEPRRSDVLSTALTLAQARTVSEKAEDLRDRTGNGSETWTIQLVIGLIFELAVLVRWLVEREHERELELRRSQPWRRP